MGLIRKAIVLGGILFALPNPPATDPMVAVQPSVQISSFATIAAAAETVADVKGFCERRPQACVTGQYLAVTLEGKARYGVKLAYEWANMAKGETAKAEAPLLRLATLSEQKPQSIEDLLRKTTAE
jgi:Family of unknown function (DUF5330)